MTESRMLYWETYEVNLALPIFLHLKSEGCIELALGIFDKKERLMRPFSFGVLSGGQEDLEGVRCS